MPELFGPRNWGHCGGAAAAARPARARKRGKTEFIDGGWRGLKTGSRNISPGRALEILLGDFSLRRPTAVHEEDLPGHVARIVGSEKDRWSDHLFGFGGALQRDGPAPLAGVVGIIAKVALNLGGPGREGIHSDPEAGQFDGELFGQRMNPA